MQHVQHSGISSEKRQIRAGGHSSLQQASHSRSSFGVPHMPFHEGMNTSLDLHHFIHTHPSNFSSDLPLLRSNVPVREMVVVAAKHDPSRAPTPSPSGPRATRKHPSEPRLHPSDYRTPQALMARPHLHRISPLWPRIASTMNGKTCRGYWMRGPRPMRD